MLKGYIYIIECKEENKIYIGSTCNPKDREHTHFYLLKKNKHRNSNLQELYNKGYTLEFSILEEYNINSIEDRKHLNIRELEVINSYPNNVNIKHTLYL